MRRLKSKHTHSCFKNHCPLSSCVANRASCVYDPRRQIAADWARPPRRHGSAAEPVRPSPPGPPHAAVRAGPAVAAATTTKTPAAAAAQRLARLRSAARPHYAAAGFDVVCEALPALLQPVALPPGHSSSCQQVSLLPLILPYTHTHTHSVWVQTHRIT